jgi:hypothetical protein
VVSILLAFSIDAWWSRVQERDDERRALEALRGEFIANLTHLRAVHDAHDRFAHRLEQLVDGVSPESQGRIIQVSDSVLLPLVSFRTADPAVGTLNILLASGRVGLIRSEDLQQALAGWPSVLEDAAEDEELIRDFIFGQLIAGLGGYMDITTLLLARGPDRLTGKQYPIVVNPTTRTLIGQRSQLAYLVVGQSQRRLETGEAILAMIERDLSR